MNQRLFSFLIIVLMLPVRVTFLFAAENDRIQMMIDDALPGDTIYLPQGTYNETSIVIDKPLVILGQQLPIIDGNNAETVVTIESDDVLIRGVHIRNSGYSSYNDLAGLIVENSRNVLIDSCFIENCFFGVYLSDVQNCSVTNSRIYSNKLTETGSGNGVHAWKCDSILVKHNDIKGNRDGIYLEFVTNSSVENNQSHDNIRYGLHFMFSHNDTYTNNTFERNGAGVAVMYTKHVTMIGNKFLSNRGVSSYGLLLKDISDSHIEDNLFNDNTSAISMEESNRINIFNNEFNMNGWAIKVQASCSGNIIKNNNFVGNTFDITTNGQTVMNTFDHNYWDKYTGYDLDKDKFGDVPYLPVSMYAIIVERLPVAMILYRSFVVTLLEQIEKIIPSLTPVDLVDNNPLMKPIVHD